MVRSYHIRHHALITGFAPWSNTLPNEPEKSVKNSQQPRPNKRNTGPNILIWRGLLGQLLQATLQNQQANINSAVLPTTLPRPFATTIWHSTLFKVVVTIGFAAIWRESYLALVYWQDSARCCNGFFHARDSSDHLGSVAYYEAGQLNQAQIALHQTDAMIETAATRTQRAMACNNSRRYQRIALG